MATGTALPLRPGSGGGVDALQRPLTIWQTAALELPEKYQQVLDFNSTYGADDLLKVVQEKQAESEKKQWSVGGSRVRDTFTKIAKWLQHFVAVGDVAVQFDPVHAALPWAAVRFLLMVAVNDSENQGFILTGIEEVSSTIVYAQCIEDLYFGCPSKALEPLQRHCLTLYKSVLNFLAKAKRFYEIGKSTRVVKAFVSRSASYQVIIDTIKVERRSLYDFTSVVDRQLDRQHADSIRSLSLTMEQKHEVMRTILNNISDKIDSIGTQVFAVADGLQQSEREELLRWLSSIPYWKHHYEMQRDILHGTGEWLLTDSLYVNWQNSTSSELLWLRGPPGYGKSKLTSIVIDHLLDESRKGTSPRPHYFYCTRDPGEKERGVAASVISCLARQMSCLTDKGQILRPAMDKYLDAKRAVQTSATPTNKEVLELISLMMAYRPVTYLLIDALDECNFEERKELIKSLLGLFRKSKSCLKVFVSSRSNLDIAERLKDFPNVVIDADKNRNDIDLFIEAEVRNAIQESELLFGKPTPHLTEKIIGTLKNKSDGMFRWVQLQLQYMCTLKTPGLVDQRLGQLPQSLAQIYDDIYEKNVTKADRCQKALIESIFQCMMAKEYQISSEAFAEAVSIRNNDRTTVEAILDLTFNFLIHEQFTNTLRFFHTSVQEFLETKFDHQANHCVLAITCIRRLLAANTEGELHLCLFQEPDYLEEGFFPYAYSHWLRHVSESNSYRETNVALRWLLMKMLLPKNFTKWRWKLLSDISAVSGNEPASPKSRRREKYIGTGTPLSHANEDCDSPFNSIAVWGLIELVPEMLEAYQYKTPQLRAISATKATYLACKWGWSNLVELLLPTTQNIDLIVSGRTALHWASSRGYEDIVSKLLHFGTDVDRFVDDEQDTAMSLASANGHLQVIELLHRQGANINLGHPLHRQRIRERLDVVHWYIKNSIDLEASDRDANTPLLLAARRNMLELAKVLIAGGANPRAKNRRGDTSLQLAIRYNRADSCRILVADVLLKQDVDINVRNAAGLSLLHEATQAGSTGVVRILLEHGVEVNAKCPKGNTPLHVASGADLVKILVDHGASVHEPNGSGQTPLLRIVSEYQIRSGGTHRYSPSALQRISHTENARNEAVQATLAELIRHGAKVDDLDQWGYSPLQIALHGAKEDLVRFLLANGAKLDVQAERLLAGDTALIAAIKKELVELVKIMLLHGANVQRRNHRGQSPMDIVAWRVSYNEYYAAVSKARQGDLRCMASPSMSPPALTSDLAGFGQSPIADREQDLTLTARGQIIVLLLEHGAENPHNDNTAEILISTDVELDRKD